MTGYVATVYDTWTEVQGERCLWRGLGPPRYSQKLLVFVFGICCWIRRTQLKSECSQRGGVVMVLVGLRLGAHIANTHEAISWRVTTELAFLALVDLSPTSASAW